MDDDVRLILTKIVIFVVIVIGITIIFAIWGVPYRPHMFDFFANARNGSASIMGFRVV